MAHIEAKPGPPLGKMMPPIPNPELLALVKRHCGHDAWRCACGIDLAFYGHSYDRWAEHLAVVIETHLEEK